MTGEAARPVDTSPHVPWPEFLRSLLPRRDALVAALARRPDGPLVLLGREPHAYASTFPSEILRCLAPDGRELRILCKYEAGRGDDGTGHRSGIAYEDAVYREVLRRCGLPAPELHGLHRDAASGDAWLMLEYLEGAIPADEAALAPHALRMASAWIGRFHACGDRRATAPAFLKAYDGAYYEQWSRRTDEFAEHWHQRLPWLRALCRWFPTLVPELLAVPATVIHGEFTPDNVLVRDEVVYPVDWQSAAIAPGEIDVVGLTDKWPAAVRRDCEHAYAHARWGDDPPPGFERRLDLARVYWDLRWLGDRPHWTVMEKVGARFEHLRDAADRLGFQGVR